MKRTLREHWGARRARDNHRATVVLPADLQPLATSVIMEADPIRATTVLAADYARRGKPLATFLDDLNRTHRALGMQAPDLCQVRSVSIAWAEAFCESRPTMYCCDRLNGLNTEHHFEVRSNEPPTGPEAQDRGPSLGIPDTGPAIAGHLLLVGALALLACAAILSRQARDPISQRN